MWLPSPACAGEGAADAMSPIRFSAAARLTLAVAAAVALGGCATKSDIRDLQAELRALAQRQDSLIEELRRETLSTQDTLRTQTDQLFDFRGQVFREFQAIRQALATIEALAGENQRGIAGVRDQLANLRRPAGPAVPVTPSEGGEGGAVAGGVGGEPAALYRTAMEQLGRGSYATARVALEELLRAHPGHELAPDAHFYLAHILQEENRLESALEAFRKVQELFPTAARVPDALYRIGVIQFELGEEDEAVATLERVVNTYPGTTAAMAAQTKLDEIR